MNRIKTAIILTLVVWPLVGLTQDQRPNVLFILVDDMGWSDLASYGHKIHETPHTDRLAREGMRFTDAYAPAPVCGPSRCAIMTGKFPSRTGFTDNYITLKGKKTKQFMPLEEFTLGEAFDRCDGGAVGLQRQHGAAFGRLSIHMHNAGAALAGVATDMSASQA